MQYRLKQNWGIYKAGDVIEDGWIPDEPDDFPELFYPVHEQSQFNPTILQEVWHITVDSYAPIHIWRLHKLFATEAEAIAARDKVKELLLSLHKV